MYATVCLLSFLMLLPRIALIINEGGLIVYCLSGLFQRCLSISLP